MRSLRRVGLLALAGSLLLAGGLRMAAGYRFQSEIIRGPFFHGEGEQFKERWDPEIWGPGATMTVAVPDDPRWVETFDYFESMADVRRLVSEAAAVWSGISSADIRWEVGESPAADEKGIPVRLSDVPDPDFVAYAWVSLRLDAKGVLEIKRCNVNLNVPSVRGLLRNDMRWLIAHELGHCADLDHHAEYPNIWVPGRRDRPSMWGGHSIMGVTLDEPTRIPEGDTRAVQHTERIGASLLRPAPGWLEATGAIYGTVLGADFGSEIAGMGLLAARIGLDGRPRDAVTRVTNQWGQFTVEGLAPGEYVLMLYGRGLPPGWTTWEDAPRIHKTIRLDPVRVRAGERIGPIVLTARRPAEENVP